MSTAADSGRAPRGGGRIALIHATRLSMAPIEAAFAERWPDGAYFHLLEESLSADRLRPPTRAAASLADRFIALSRYAALAGAAGILYTCSAFGAEIDAAKRAVALPMLKPNEAMLDEALAIGARVGLVATFEPSLASIADELRDAAAARGIAVDVVPVFVPGAMDALAAGDAAAHDRAIAGAARMLRSVDVVLLAQFSMARARREVGHGLAVPVLTSPESAVDAMRRAMAGGSTSHKSSRNTS